MAKRQVHSLATESKVSLGDRSWSNTTATVIPTASASPTASHINSCTVPSTALSFTTPSAPRVTPITLYIVPPIDAPTAPTALTNFHPTAPPTTLSIAPPTAPYATPTTLYTAPPTDALTAPPTNAPNFFLLLQLFLIPSPSPTFLLLLLIKHHQLLPTAYYRFSKFF